MKCPISWRIYYGDGSTFDNCEGEPCHAPATGVIAIAQVNPIPGENPYIQHMTDYYIWLGNHWLGCDMLRLFQYWFVDGHKYAFPRASLSGETIMNQDYLDIRMRAKRDEDIFA